MSSFTYAENTVAISDKPSITNKIAGTGTAIVTPFIGDDATEVDYEGLKSLVDSQIAGGVDFIVPVGTTGECPTLSHAEHELVIKTVVDRVAGRIPVVAGTGSNNTKEAISLTTFAKNCGADAVLIVNPYYNKPSQNGLFLHFQAIAAAVDIPIVLYNIPSRTGITMQPETVAKLWNEIPNIVSFFLLSDVACSFFIFHSFHSLSNNTRFLGLLFFFFCLSFFSTCLPCCSGRHQRGHRITRHCIENSCFVSHTNFIRR